VKHLLSARPPDPAPQGRTRTGKAVSPGAPVPGQGNVKDVLAQIVYKKIVESEPTTMHAHGPPPLKRADILVVIWLSLLI